MSDVPYKPNNRYWFWQVALVALSLLSGYIRVLAYGSKHRATYTYLGVFHGILEDHKFQRGSGIMGPLSQGLV